MFEQYKKAGYTHYIEYDVLSEVTKVWTRTGFPTTEDACLVHLKSLRHNKNAKEIIVKVL